MEKEEDVGKGCPEPKSTGEKQEFGARAVFHRLSCWGSGFLAGDAAFILPVGSVVVTPSCGGCLCRGL